MILKKGFNFIFTYMIVGENPAFIMAAGANVSNAHTHTRTREHHVIHEYECNLVTLRSAINARVATIFRYNL